jgi:hypothetical protein
MLFSVILCVLCASVFIFLLILIPSPPKNYLAFLAPNQYTNGYCSHSYRLILRKHYYATITITNVRAQLCLPFI